jgi:Flp pilus assembly protein TadD
MRRTLAAAVLGSLLLASVPDAFGAAEPAELDILALSPEMGRFLARRIRPGQVRQLRLNALLDVIFGEDGLKITYGNSRTRTAIETFEERSGNCLSFTLMFVSMARHLGLRAYFREVDEVTSWDQRGDVVVTERHMFAEVEADNGLVQVDFLPPGAKVYRSTRRVDTYRVYAHYYSNLGVETLTAGETADSIKLFEKALQYDPGFSQALVNMGVALRRNGEPVRAEESFLLALEVDSGEMAAVSNLAALYLGQGRAAEAAPLLDRVAGHLRRNPFHHFKMGLRASRDEQWEAAIGHVREAIRRRPEEALFHVELAQLQIRIGREAPARSSLERALDLAEDSEERQRISALLTELDGTR